MKELTIDEVIYLWSVKYKYDHILHGFTFPEDDKMSDEKVNKTMNNLKSKYGDMM